MTYKVAMADIQKLRKSTGAGMMDCKKALQEAEGNFEKAKDIIREKGQAIANKRADREAKEGIIVTETNNQYGYILALNCETDFVAKTDKFIQLAKTIMNAAIQTEASSVDEVRNAKVNDITVSEMINEQIGVIGEKIDIPFYQKVEAPYINAYIHNGNKLAALVMFNKKPENEQLAHDIAMQVAAMNPIAVDKDDIPQDIIEKEKEIAKEQARNENRPENLLEKIAMGKLNKFYQEVTLLNQQFIREHKMTVKDYIKQNDPDLQVVKFVRYSLSD
ncbi:MAG TPA: elongation factor Ts [Bacteroidales bacterium]|nr:elongation factor Ts [Bacteroidales bacterium]